MTCGKCPNCGDQMEEESVYGVKVCRCQSCGFKTKKPKEGTKAQNSRTMWVQTEK